MGVLFLAFVLVTIAIRADEPILPVPPADPDRLRGAAAPAFEPNRGRMPAAVDFVLRSSAGTVALTDRGLSIGREEGGRLATLQMVLTGATLRRPEGAAERAGVVNDLRGDDPESWRTGIPTFGRVRYASAYPGIDLVYRAERGEIEYDFRLASGADAGAIGLAFPGAAEVRVLPDGDLSVRRDGATFRQSSPVAYQPGPDGREPVAAGFRRDGREVSIEVGTYDRARPLVIDPVVFDYSTYLGGADADRLNALTVDADGSAYVAGETDSADFNRVGEIEGDEPDEDVVVAKLNAAGDGLVFSTYLGGDDDEDAEGIAVGPSGGVYVTGKTNSSDFNTVGEIEGDSFGADGFVSKLNPAGDDLVYSTYLGGDNGDFPEAIAVDVNGAAYVAGSTFSSDFDTEDPIYGDGPSQDGFVTKLNPAGDNLVYSTYLSGDSSDLVGGIAVRGGAAYVTGVTDSTDFPIDGEIEIDSPGRDVFVSKLNAAGDNLVYSTYIGGSGWDQGNAIAVGSDGSAYITGESRSTDYDMVNPIEGSSANGDWDAIVSKLTPAGDALTYSTYLGGTGTDFSRSIALDDDGSVSIAGTTSSADFDLVGEMQPYAGENDAFVSTLSPDGGQLLFSTYIGGAEDDEAGGVAVESDALYAAGTTGSSDYPTEGGIEGDEGDEDGFVTKLVTKPYLETTIVDGPGANAVIADSTPTFDFAASGPAEGFECRFDGAAFAPCSSPHTPAPLSDGDHLLEVRAVDGRLTDPTPATRGFEVDTTGPNTKITKWPKAKQRRLKGKRDRVELKFAWDSNDPEAEYECRFDKAEFKRCNSPKWKKLDRGKHTLRVRATDALGNREADPVVRKLEVKKAKKKRKGR